MSSKFGTHVMTKEKTVDFVVAFCGICISWVAWFVPSTVTVPLYVFSIVLIVSILIVAKLYLYASLCKQEIESLELKLSRQSDGYLPKLISITAKENRNTIILSTKAPFFRHNMDVSIIYEKEGLEETIATATIINIQSNDLMQSEIVSVEDGCEEMFNDILRNQSLYRNKIKILPRA